MSTTTNLKLFKHDNPTTNTNQFDVEKALNENWDKIDKNAGEIASKIQTLENTTSKKDTSQDTEIEALKAENALLKSQIPSATVLGKTIHLEDSSNMQCQISPIGASKQETREGYNYLDVANLIAQGCTITWENDILTISSNDVAYANGYIDITHLFKNNSGKQLYFDYEAILATITGASSLVQLIIGYNDGTSTSYQELVRADYGKRPYTIPADTSNIKSCRVCIYSNNYAELNGEQTTTITKPILQFGTETKEYEQYGASPSIEYEAPIESVGDNINYIDLSNLAEQTIVGVRIKPNKDGSFTLDGTSTNSYGFNVAVNNGKTLKANTPYTLEVTSTGTASSTSNSQIAIREDENTNLVNVSFSGNSKIYTPTKDETINYLRIYLDTGVTFTNFTVYPKLEKGTIATQYSPYRQGSIGITLGNGITSETKSLYTQQPFRAIGDVKDMFVKMNGVWYEEHSIKRFIFTGDDNWLYYADSRWKFRLQISDILPFTNEQTLAPTTILSNCFSATEWTNTENDGKFTGMKDINKVLCFGYNNVSSLEDWKNLLAELYNAGTPVYVDYVLAEPTLIECTPEQAETLESFNTYKNITNISSDSIGELEVFYYKDLETLLGGV